MRERERMCGRRKVRESKCGRRKEREKHKWRRGSEITKDKKGKRSERGRE